MKKTALIGLFTLVALAGYAQPKIGLRLAPGLSFNSVEGQGPLQNIDNDGAAVRFSIGPTADFFFSDNYAFSTGLWYTVKRSKIQIPPGGLISGESDYNLQYLQVPVMLKLYTNEVATDMRVYFNVGGTVDIKIAEKNKGENSDFLYALADTQDRNAYGPVDAGVLLGAGAELVMGANTIVFGGLSYNRSFINTINPSLTYFNGTDEVDLNNDLKVTNSIFAIEIGLKF